MPPHSGGVHFWTVSESSSHINYLELFGISLKIGTRLRQYSKSSSSSSSVIFLYMASLSLNCFKIISSATSLFILLPLRLLENSSALNGLLVVCMLLSFNFRYCNSGCRGCIIDLYIRTIINC